MSDDFDYEGEQVDDDDLEAMAGVPDDDPKCEWYDVTNGHKCTRSAVAYRQAPGRLASIPVCALHSASGTPSWPPPPQEPRPAEMGGRTKLLTIELPMNLRAFCRLLAKISEVVPDGVLQGNELWGTVQHEEEDE